VSYICTGPVKKLVWSTFTRVNLRIKSREWDIAGRKQGTGTMRSVTHSSVEICSGGVKAK